MQLILYIEINVIGMIILFLIIKNMHSVSDNTSRQKVFKRLSVVLMIMLILDSAIWMVDKQVFPFSVGINYAINTVYFILHGYIGFLWLKYVCLYFGIYKQFFRSRWLLMWTPAALNTVVLLLNLKFGWVFHINKENLYQRGICFFIPVMLSFLYLLTSAILAFARSKRASSAVEKRKCISILGFLFLPAVAGVIQAFIYGVSLVWICMVLSFLMVFINVQNNQISTDVLTGLNNRCEFDRYLLRMFESKSRDDYTLLMIDVNKFKSINDTYGHVCGDRALMKVAGILKKSCGNTNAFLARYGGDEFTIVCRSRLVAHLLGEISKRLTQFNHETKEPFTLSLSIGEARFHQSGIRTVDDLIAYADQEMYLNKNK